MRSVALFLSLAILFNVNRGFAKIVTHNGEFFVANKDARVPIFKVNELIKKGHISRVKLYGGGSVHLITFTRGSEKEKLYSVDEKGFIYSIKPFEDYSVTEVDDQGNFKFREIQSKKFFINQNGFFLH